LGCSALRAYNPGVGLSHSSKLDGIRPSLG
jgi:hypothetical protein